jgi:uncharacterized protein YkwD
MKKIIIGLAALILILPFYPVSASTSLANRLSGRIILAVQQSGEAWYVNPKNLERYSLNDPFSVIKQVGVGISNADLAKIPLAGSAAKISNQGQLNFIVHAKGKIFLQVQDRGQAWYVNPINGQRYYLTSLQGINAVIKMLGLGISNANLAQITAAQSPSPSSSAQPQLEPQNPLIAAATPYDLSYLEQKINSLVNAERVKNGLSPLAWNSDVANVAREHSQELAQENESLTAMNKICDYFMIHHESFSLGLYQDNRLNNAGIDYFSASGENIAMQGGKQVVFSSGSAAIDQNSIDTCMANVQSANDALKASLESNISTQDKLNLITSELAKRKTELAEEGTINVVSLTYTSDDEMASAIVLGWMNSPGHRANILTAAYNESGIGVAYVNGYIIATQDFITRVSCGYKGAVCCPSYSCYVPNNCQQGNICQ